MKPYNWNPASRPEESALRRVVKHWLLVLKMGENMEFDLVELQTTRIKFMHIIDSLNRMTGYRGRRYICRNTGPMKIGVIHSKYRG